MQVTPKKKRSQINLSNLFINHVVKTIALNADGRAILTAQDSC